MAVGSRLDWLGSLQRSPDLLAGLWKGTLGLGRERRWGKAAGEVKEGDGKEKATKEERTGKEGEERGRRKEKGKGDKGS